nr:MAG TPA: hypothetical protein [Caudoviricetes sp.]
MSEASLFSLIGYNVAPSGPLILTSVEDGLVYA